MVNILNKITRYNKIIIITDDYSSNMSKLVFDAVASVIKVQNGLVDFTLMDKYNIKDLYGTELSRYTLRKHANGHYGNYLLRVKGIGYNLHNMGLQKSQPIISKADMILTVRRNVCYVLSDRYNYVEDINRIECDVMPLYKSYKLSKIIKRIHGNSNS